MMAPPVRDRDRPSAIVSAAEVLGEGPPRIALRIAASDPQIVVFVVGPPHLTGDPHVTARIHGHGARRRRSERVVVGQPPGPAPLAVGGVAGQPSAPRRARTRLGATDHHRARTIRHQAEPERDRRPLATRGRADPGRPQRSPAVRATPVIIVRVAVVAALALVGHAVAAPGGPTIRATHRPRAVGEAEVAGLVALDPPVAAARPIAKRSVLGGRDDVTSTSDETTGDRDDAGPEPRPRPSGAGRNRARDSMLKALDARGATGSTVTTRTLRILRSLRPPGRTADRSEAQSPREYQNLQLDYRSHIGGGYSVISNAA